MKRLFFLCAAVFLLFGCLRLMIPYEGSNENVHETYEEIVVTGVPDYVIKYPDLYAKPDGNGEKESGNADEDCSQDVCEDGKTQENNKEQSLEKREGKVAYLTFDDGPSECTRQVLALLKKEKIHATFFLIGEEITPEREEIVKQMAEEGHCIGLHTDSHNYKKIYSSVDAFLSDYEKVYRKIVETAGVYPTIYRFPGGSTNRMAGHIPETISIEMARRGFRYFDWNVSAEDSVGKPTYYSIRTNVFKDVFRYSESVILMHDSSANELTVSFLPDLIESLRESGYRFDTLDHCEECCFLKKTAKKAS